MRYRKTAILCIYGLAAIATLAVATPVYAADYGCAGLATKNTGATGQPRLCRYPSGSGKQLAVCIEYRDTTHVYDLVFNSGPSPIAFVRHDARGYPANKTDPATTRLPENTPACTMKPPKGIPSSAQFHGIGVCESDSGQPLPCSAFEHSGARVSESTTFLVYYEPDGRGVRHIDPFATGPNEQALVAELAYQIGWALARTGCCEERARHYFAYAEWLYPDDRVYRDAMVGPGNGCGDGRGRSDGEHHAAERRP